VVPGEDAKALVPSLPGEQEADDELIDTVVHGLNEIYEEKGLETACLVGRAILANFFDGDPENFRKKGKRHASFRKLAEREDLRFGYGFLWSSVAVVAQLEELPEDLVKALPLSHHKLLLPLKKKDKLQLAEKAVEDGWSKRELDEEAAKVRRKYLRGDRRGRPPYPAFVKGFSRIRKAIEAAGSERITVRSFDHYDADEARELLDGLEQDLKTLKAVREKVRRALKRLEAKAKKDAEEAGADNEEAEVEDDG